MKVQKRDGRIVDFDREKIINAIEKAFKAVDSNISDYAKTKAENIAEYIFNYAQEQWQNNNKILNIEEIQSLCENGLMSTKRKDVARAYITYREERTKEREKNSDLLRLVKMKAAAKQIENQNANVDEQSFGGRLGEASSALMKKLALDEFVSPKARKRHLNNEIYIHDLDHYVLGDHNCLSIPFDKLLAEGFNTRQTDVRPANSINTAMQLVAVIFQLQSLQQFGGVSATHLDWTMVPYVRKSFAKYYRDGLYWISNIKPEDIDYEIENMLINASDWSIDDCEYEAYNEDAYRYAHAMTQKELQQAVEGMYHNLNTLQSRSGEL